MFDQTQIQEFKEVSEGRKDSEGWPKISLLPPSYPALECAPVLGQGGGFRIP